ncbi:hypothetical protein [Pseudofrankia inefficax]|uniref:Secreted protein n=1 Tax=Pseudofrankia inefficax (strain DSM 45817 / CECT 9037 / DDB 130130 / EuI1c) TaxID=298654 RepID=E3IZU9_PSEI1|nr:hypothetical protein [Pseudofrankia inefficax]ADP85141.1 hypothetical protein FraEuI1c_7177 [Pseudofrankia inefficax]
MNRKRLATSAVLTALVPAATAITSWSSTAQATTTDCSDGLKTLYHTNLTYWYTDSNGKTQYDTNDVAGWVELRKSSCGVKAYVSLTGGSHFHGGELTGRVANSADGSDGASNVYGDVCGMDGATTGSWCATGFIPYTGLLNWATGSLENDYPATHGYYHRTPLY